MTFLTMLYSLRVSPKVDTIQTKEKKNHMKKATKIVLALLVLSMMAVLFTACGNDDDKNSTTTKKKSAEEKQADYEALLKDLAKVELKGKGAQAVSESKGMKMDEQVAENGDFQSVISGDKFSLTITHAEDKNYIKGFFLDEAGAKQEFAYIVPQGNTTVSEETALNINPTKFTTIFKDENGNAGATASEVKYVKTEGGKDYVTLNLTEKAEDGEEPEVIPLTFLFEESSQKLAGMIYSVEGETMNINFDSYSVSVDASAYKEGSDSDIMAAMLGVMAYMMGE